MTRERLLLMWRLARALSGSKTGLAILGLYAVVTGILWMASNGWIAPDGTVDLRLWINGHIVNVPKFQVWWPGGGLAALLSGFGLYGRTVAKGPLLSVAKVLSPEAAAIVQNLLRQADPLKKGFTSASEVRRQEAEILASLEADAVAPSDERPEPVTLRPAAGGLGATATSATQGGGV